MIFLPEYRPGAEPPVPVRVATVIVFARWAAGYLLALAISCPATQTRRGVHVWSSFVTS
jgi:hypothetical protein